MERRWNDKKKSDNFQTGDLADEIHRDLIRFLLHDFSVEGLDSVEKHYVAGRMNRTISIMEDICTILRDGWSIQTMYGVDYEQRRIRWTAARGLCFRLMGLLDNVLEFIPKVRNKQKYFDISAKLMTLAQMIQAIIASDDKRRKKNCKKYMGDG